MVQVVAPVVVQVPPPGVAVAVYPVISCPLSGGFPSTHWKRSGAVIARKPHSDAILTSRALKIPGTQPADLDPGSRHHGSLLTR